MAEVSKLKVADLNSYEFSIPRSYQRGYRWRAEHEVKKLLNDIYSSNEEYSLQPLILCRKAGSDISFDVVDGQQRLTTLLLILRGEKEKFNNFYHDAIDEFYLKNAKERINNFLSNLSKEDKKTFLEKVNNAFFISYIVEDDEDEIKKIFTRVNEGKIPLSSAELLKAWLFTAIQSPDVRAKWNEMEKLLEDDYFYYMINPDPDSPRYYATRMDYLAELVEIIIAGEKKAKDVENYYDRDRNYVFFSLAENNKPEDVIKNLYSFFSRLKACYEDIEKYNRLGYLINRKNASDPYSILTNLSKKELNSINTLIKDINKLNYYGSHEPIENTLLLFNLTFYYDERFNFKIYQEVRKRSGWTLDHIHAKNEELLSGDSLKKLEIQIDCKSVKKAKEKYPFDRNPLEYQNLLYDLRDGVQIYDEETNDFKVIDTSIEEWIHSIGNLVLLEHNQNSSFNNSSVAAKLNELKNKLANPDDSKYLFKGTICAYNIAKDSKQWGKAERDKYLNKIETRLSKYFGKSVGEIGNLKDVEIDFTAETNSDKYGNTISHSQFESNKAVNLIDILSRYDIVVPDFQREYAQGRTDEQSKFVRNMFITDIFDFLRNKKEKMELDFVYGRINDKNEFFPFDGQQRLTTLFLIYSEFFCDNRKYKRLLSKFRYADRPEAEEYCNFCIEGGNELSGSTTPSVVGMKTMKDAIREKIKEENMEHPLNKDKLDSIVFYIPSDISLSPDIYWKMNSRGKRLTPLERFKSSWFGKNEKTAAEGIDRIALKFFKENSEKYEERFMGLISVMFNAFDLIENCGKKTDFFNSDLVPSSYYLAFKSLKDGLYTNSINTLFKTLSDDNFDLTEFQKDFTDTCPAYTGKPLIDECFKRGKNEKAALLFSYLLTTGKDLNKEALKDWMRFCANIIWNASTPDDALKIIFALQSKSNEILSYLSREESKEVSKMVQYSEERAKAIAILNDEVKKKDIVKAESTAFAEGRIDFLFFDGWNGFNKRLENFNRWFDDIEGVRKICKECIVTTYIKLSPWDWSESYFNTSKDHWKNKILGGINDKDFGDGYRHIVSNLLAADNLYKDITLTDFKSLNGHTLSSKHVRQSLVNNPWFIKWMMKSCKDNFQIYWAGDSYTPCAFFHEPNKRCYIYWDVGGWKNSNDGLEQEKEVNKFFWSLKNKKVLLSEENWRLIDENGNDVSAEANKEDNSYANEKYNDNYHLLTLINTWGNYGLVKFKYEDVDFWLLPQGIILLDANEDPAALWRDPERNIYKNGYNKLRSEEELLDTLEKLRKLKMSK